MLRIQDVYPGSWFLPIPDPGSRIPDPKTTIVVKPFFVATNFTKLDIILFLIYWRKKFGLIFQELLKFLPQKLSPSPQKVISKKTRKNYFLLRTKRAGPNPDPVVRGTVPRIRNRTKMARIRNTVEEALPSHSWAPCWRGLRSPRPTSWGPPSGPSASSSGQPTRPRTNRAPKPSQNKTKPPEVKRTNQRQECALRWESQRTKIHRLGYRFFIDF